MRTLGIIGCGNIGGAILRRAVKNGAVGREDIIAAAPREETREEIERELSVRTTADNRLAAAQDMVALTVKPQVYPTVLKEIAPVLREDAILLTVAPGMTLERVQAELGAPRRIVRCMPNMPALVGEGMIAACRSESVTDAEYQAARAFLSCLGRVEDVPEKLMDTVVGVSGSAPAYVFMLVEAMAQAGIRGGMSRAQATRFAAQSVLGSAKLALETGEHPAELRDQVCSPGGTTIEAVRVLEEKGFKSTVMEAIDACIRRSSEL